MTASDLHSPQVDGNGPHNRLAARPNREEGRQQANPHGGRGGEATGRGSSMSDEERQRDGSETPELISVEVRRTGGEEKDDGEKGASGTGSGPSGMDTERGNSNGQQGVGSGGSSGDGEVPSDPKLQGKKQEKVVKELTWAVTKTGLGDGKDTSGKNLERREEPNLGRIEGQGPGEQDLRERRAPVKIYMLESSDEDEADVDDEEGGGLDEVDDLDGCWQTTTLPAKHLRVLLVEDDDCTRHVVAALLRNCGYEVTAAADGLEALKLLSDKMKQFDLVLTEVVMPRLSGIELLTKIQQREQHKRMPVIMMSSKDATDVVFKCFQRGAADFLVKPVRKNELKNLWQHVWRRCKSSSGSGSGGSGTNTVQKVPRKERGRVRDGSGDRSGSGSDSAGGQINVGGNGSDNGSGTRNESSPVPDDNNFAHAERQEPAPTPEEKTETPKEDTPEPDVEDLLQNVGGKGEEISRGAPLRDRGGDAGADMRGGEEEGGSPSRESGKAADLIGNFIEEEKGLKTPPAKPGKTSEPTEGGGEGGGRDISPGLELSLKRGRPGGSNAEDGQPPSKQQLRTLRQSGGSAFSRYSMGGAISQSSRHSQNQPQLSQQHMGGYSSGPIGPPRNVAPSMGSFMPPDFQMASPFQMPTHLLPPEFSNPRTVEAGPEMQGPPRLNSGSGEFSSGAINRQSGSGGQDNAGPVPPHMKEEYSAGAMGPSPMARPPQGFMPPGYPEPGFAPFPPQFGYFFQPQNTSTPPAWNPPSSRKDPPNPPLPPSKPQNPNKEVIHHHHHHHHHAHHHDKNAAAQRQHDGSHGPPRQHDVSHGPPRQHKHSHHKVSHPQASRAGEAPGGESGLTGSSRQEIAQSRKEQAGKVAAHLDRVDHMEHRESTRREALDNSGGSDAIANSSGNQSGGNNGSGGGSNFGSNGRTFATGATTETGTGTRISGSGVAPTGKEAEPSQHTAAQASPAPEAWGADMSIDGMDETERCARRVAALTKFRQKRKERCFEKKVRYQSRKRLAEQRPRIRGQFVRQAMFPNAVQQFVKVPGDPATQGESIQ